MTGCGGVRRKRFRLGFHLERHSRHLRAADKTYEVTLDREGWPVREIDSGTGEIVTFDRGPEKVFGQIPMSRRRLLTLHAAAERADARLGWR